MNINIGILGHIDSGKTALCRVLAEIASTASMDKAKASQERGITMDLGFSSFQLPTPDRFETTEKELHFTLVDCPGHASLIRQVIGAAQIIDLCCLIVDVTKGIQTQTAECIVVAELLANQLIVVLNKIDLLPEETRQDDILKQIKK